MEEAGFGPWQSDSNSVHGFNYEMGSWHSQKLSEVKVKKDLIDRITHLDVMVTYHHP